MANLPPPGVISLEVEESGTGATLFRDAYYTKSKTVADLKKELENKFKGQIATFSIFDLGKKITSFNDNSNISNIAKSSGTVTFEVSIRKLATAVKEEYKNFPRTFFTHKDLEKLIATYKESVESGINYGTYDEFLSGNSSKKLEAASKLLETAGKNPQITPRDIAFHLYIRDFNETSYFVSKFLNIPEIDGLSIDITFDEEGNLYIALPTIILKVSPQKAVTIFAGKLERGGNTLEDGPVATATFDNILGLCFLKGALYVAEGSGFIRVVKEGFITTLCGSALGVHPNYDDSEDDDWKIKDGQGDNAVMHDLQHIFVIDENTLGIYCGNNMARVTIDGNVKSVDDDEDEDEISKMSSQFPRKSTYDNKNSLWAWCDEDSYTDICIREVGKDGRQIGIDDEHKRLLKSLQKSPFYKDLIHPIYEGPIHLVDLQKPTAFAFNNKDKSVYVISANSKEVYRIYKIDENLNMEGKKANAQGGNRKRKTYRKRRTHSKKNARSSRR